MRTLSMSLLAGALALTSFVAYASDADFKLVNKTRYQIDEVYVSKHSSDSWGRDIMGSDALGNGESVNITFPHSGNACHFDIKVVYHDGDKAEFDDVNLCDYDKITLFWDASKQTTKAIGE
jgi:hypothetical protein